MTCECPAHQWLGRECECLCDHNEDSPETKVMRVKRHFRENKDRYICLIVGAVAAGGAAVAYSKKTPTISGSLVNYKSEGASIQNITQVIIPAKGDPGNYVQDVTTGTTWASQNEAAKELGVSPARISQYLNGNSAADTVAGHRLVRLGKAVPAEFIPV